MLCVFVSLKHSLYGRHKHEPFQRQKIIFVCFALSSKTALSTPLVCSSGCNVPIYNDTSTKRAKVKGGPIYVFFPVVQKPCQDDSCRLVCLQRTLFRRHRNGINGSKGNMSRYMSSAQSSKTLKQQQLIFVLLSGTFSFTTQERKNVSKSKMIQFMSSAVPGTLETHASCLPVCRLRARQNLDQQILCLLPSRGQARNRGPENKSREIHEMGLGIVLSTRCVMAHYACSGEDSSKHKSHSCMTLSLRSTQQPM